MSKKPKPQPPAESPQIEPAPKPIEEKASPFDEKTNMVRAVARAKGITPAAAAQRLHKAEMEPVRKAEAEEAYRQAAQPTSPPEPS